MGLASVVAKAEPFNDAQIESRSWACGMHFKGTAKGFKIILGKFTSEATGVVSCVNIHGEKWSSPIAISFAAHTLSPKIGAGWMKYYGVAGEFSFFGEDPSVIFGKYGAMSADASVIFGVGSFRAVKLTWPSLSIGMSVQIEEGLGVAVGLDQLIISAI